MKILTDNEHLQQVSKDDSDKRILVIEMELFKKVYEKIVNSLLEKDKLLFALMFTQVKLEKLHGKGVAELFKMCFLSSKIIETTLESNLLGDLPTSTLIKLEDLSHRSGFSELLNSIRND